MKKKIIFFMPSMEGGGVEKNLIILVNFLSNKLQNLNLVSFDEVFKKKISKKVIFKSFSKKPLNLNKYFKYIICLALLIKEIIFEDVVVVSFQANIYCLIICKILNKKIIVRSNSSPKGWSKNLLKNYIYSYFIKKSDEVIVNSSDFKKQMKKKFNINPKLIYNPLNIAEIQSKAKEKINKKFYKKKFLNIINVGRLTDQKNQITLLRAIKKIPNSIKLNLLIIGYGKYEKHLNDFIKNNQLEKRTNIIKELDNSFKFISKFDLFVLTSKYEGLPNVLLESLALKTPIISTDCPTGPKEILKNGKLGTLFRVNDYIALSKLILKYYKNKNFFLKKADMGIKNLEKYDYNKNCMKYYTIIKNLN